MAAYVCLLEAHLQLPDADSLKDKRKVVKSLKEQVRHRFGAAVAETAEHDSRRTAVLLFALVGGSEVEHRADEVARFVEVRCPGGASFERDLRTLADIRD